MGSSCRSSTLRKLSSADDTSKSRHASGCVRGREFRARQSHRHSTRHSGRTASHRGRSEGRWRNCDSSPRVAQSRRATLRARHLEHRRNAIGFRTSGSAAKTVALNPGGSFIFAAASVGGIACDCAGSELYGAGNSAPSKLTEAQAKRSLFFILRYRSADRRVRSYFSVSLDQARTRRSALQSLFQPERLREGAVHRDIPRFQSDPLGRAAGWPFEGSASEFACVGHGDGTAFDLAAIPRRD